MSFYRHGLPVAALLSAFALPALAHAPFDLSGPAPSFDKAAVLPTAQSTWVIYGILQTPGLPDFIRLDNLDSSQTVSFQTEVFSKPAYAGFAPTSALIAKGLSQPTETLPFALPDGYGAIVKHFDGDPAQREISAFGLRSWFEGQTIDVPELSGTPAYIAVWDESGKTGEYTVVFNIEPDVEDPTLEGKYTDPLPGDGNEDGKVNIPDATLALQMVVGLKPITPRLLRTMDVYPPRNGKAMNGDGKVTIADVIRLLNRAIGDEPDPFP